MKKVLVAVLAALILCGPAWARRHDNYPLHPGSAGPRVAALQWLLGGHRPNVFTKVKGTYKGKPSGYFGANTSKAVYAYKYRIGYPTRYLTAKRKYQAGNYFIELLLGKRHRTKEMVALAARRVSGLVEPGVSPMALKLRLLAVSQLGVTESPWGCNCGPHISYSVNRYPAYEASTGAYYAAWCASWIQWLLWQSGYGRIADNSAGVLYIENWAQRHGYLSAKPHVGSLVAYLDDGGHIGMVMKVTASGYSEASGNSDNRVQETWHPWNYRLRVFINLPGI